jgi:hypothetical protein
MKKKLPGAFKKGVCAEEIMDSPDGLLHPDKISRVNKDKIKL